MMMRNRTIRSTVLALAATALFAVTASADGETDVSGQVRVREAYNDNHDFNGDADDAKTFATMRTRVGFARNVGERGQLFIQLQDSRTLGSETSTLASSSNVDLHQGYLRINGVRDSALDLQFGRMEMAYGTQRQIGSVGWSDVGRSFDGARAMYDIEGFGWFHIFAMKTAESNNVASTASSETAFFGGYVHHDVNEDAAVEGYLFNNYTDDGQIGPAESLVEATGSLYTAGARASWKSSGDVDVSVHAEGAYQFGTTPDSFDGTNVVDGLDIAASAYAVGINYGLPTDINAWLGVDYTYASGDSDLGNDEVGTYTQLFPTGHKFLGYADFLSWQNIADLQFNAGFKANSQWKFWTSFHLFSLPESGDSWYGLNGKPVAGLTSDDSFDSGLANEFDLSASFTPEKGINFQAHILFWMPGDWQKQATALGRGFADDESIITSAADAIAKPASLDNAITAYLQTSISF